MGKVLCWQEMNRDVAGGVVENHASNGSGGARNAELAEGDGPW
jgi:hypothetical protein